MDKRWRKWRSFLWWLCSLCSYIITRGLRGERRMNDTTHTHTCPESRCRLRAAGSPSRSCCGATCTWKRAHAAWAGGDVVTTPACLVTGWHITCSGGKEICAARLAREEATPLGEGMESCDPPPRFLLRGVKRRLRDLPTGFAPCQVATHRWLPARD
jgi:hypothetical protein